MNTAILIAIFLIALYILYRLPGRGSTGGVRTYRTELVQRSVVRTVDDVQADMLREDVTYLWRLLSARQNASRRAVVRSHEMSAWRWGKANAVVKHLRLDPAKVGYDEGMERIRRFWDDQDRLSRTSTFVPPF